MPVAFKVVCDLFKIVAIQLLLHFTINSINNVKVHISQMIFY